VRLIDSWVWFFFSFFEDGNHISSFPVLWLMNGILGQSVTFRVKFSPPFDSISWTKVDPCGLLVPDPAYRKRVNVSKDCRELHLSHLKKGDAGRFTAGIIPLGAEKVDESFDLQIFRKYPTHGSQFRASLLCDM
uniref:Immunoglobulin V-set domain-containing protein n=1 Tax=Pseudonaja textilis TaxID=8673 RepID=A0A670ZHH9_PSETE